MTPKAAAPASAVRSKKQFEGQDGPLDRAEQALRPLLINLPDGSQFRSVVARAIEQAVAAERRSFLQRMVRWVNNHGDEVGLDREIREMEREMSERRPERRDNRRRG